MDITPWLITTFTVVAVFYLDKWENQYIKSVFDWVPAILLAYLLPALISAAGGFDFSEGTIHQFSKQYVIPLAIISVMSSLSLRQLKSIGWKPILVFLSGSLWIAIFPVLVAYFFFESTLVQETLVAQEYWKGVPPIVGSWIGGSTSQLVLKEIVNCPESIFLAILVLDNILVNIWTILMFQGIKKSTWLNGLIKITNMTMPESLSVKRGKLLNPIISILLLFGAVLAINGVVGNFVMKIVLLSIAGLLFSNLIKSWNFSVALKMGGILIIVVMAILGLKLKVDLLEIELGLLSFLITWLLSHFFVMLLVAKSLNVNSAWVAIASMANVGGIATAPAVTAAYEKKWMPHAIILAILSMATGTFWGMLTIYLMEQFVL